MSVTKQQIQMMSSYMRMHPELAKSYNALSSSGRALQTRRWEQLTKSLNASGPPTKSVTEWKRVWTLRKYNTKKKLTDNKKSLGGGELKRLNATEKAIVAVCGLDAAVTGIVGALDFDSASCGIKENSEKQEFDVMEEAMDELTCSLNKDDDKLDTTNQPFKPKQENTDDEIKTEQSVQEYFFSKQLEAQNKSNQTLVEIRDAIRRLVNIREKECEAVISAKKAELQIRRRKLEIKLLELDTETALL